MSVQLQSYTLLCPYCNQVLRFQLDENEFQKRFTGGLAEVEIPAHGEPAHSLTVYIDKHNQIRGAYPKLIEKVVRKDLQFNYIADATCEISPEEGKSLGLEVLPYYVVLDGTEKKPYNEEVFFADIFDLLNSSHKVSSEPVPVEAFLEAYKKLPEDKPIIVTTISSSYSEAFNNAYKAKQLLKKENQQIASNIYILNSMTAGPLLKLIIRNSLKMDAQGKKLEDIISYIRWVSLNNLSFIYSDTLKYLRKSNRISAVTAFFGNLLNRKPIIVENSEKKGTLKNYSTVSNKEQGMKEIVKAVRKAFGNKPLAGTVFHGITEEDALELQELLVKEVNVSKDDLLIDFMGTGVGMHLGFECLGVAVYPKRKNSSL